MSDLPPAPPPPPPGFEQYPAAGVPQTHGKATASMVCGIVGLVLAFVPLLGLTSLVLAPVAIVMGVQAKREIRASEGRLTGRGMAQAGVVCGIITAGLLVAGVIATIALMSD
jgi:hypothetical protein